MRDANGTRLHVLLGAADWEPAVRDARPAVEWDAEAGEVLLERKVFAFPPPRGERPPEPADRRGAARDRFGTVHFVDGARTGLLAQGAGDGIPAPSWPEPPKPPVPGASGGFGPVTAPAPAAPAQLTALAITCDDVLVASTVEPSGLLLFDLRSGGPPQRLAWPAGAPVAAVALAPRPTGGVLVLEPGRLHALDRAFRLEGSPRIAPADALTVAVAADDSVLVVTGGATPALHRGDDHVPLADTARGVGSSIHAAVLLAPAVPGTLGRLVVADASGNQCYAFDVALAAGRPTVSAVPVFLPMRRYGGRGLVAGPGYGLYDSGDRWLPLVCQSRPRFGAEGSIVVGPFDGREPGCVWHRLLLDARIPPTCQVTVESRTAERASDLATAGWAAEPAPVPRPAGSEQPFAPPPERSGYETVETLLQAARGRFCQLRLTLAGDGRSSPRLHTLRLRYPRFSYVERYLPALYREDAASASFLERYLANVEGMDTELEDRVAAAQVLLDPSGAPAEALEWLAAWFDVALDPAWEEHRRRVFLRCATRLFAMRGTVPGLQSAVRLATDPLVDETLLDRLDDPATSAIRVVEHFRSRRWGAVAGDPDAAASWQSAAGRWTPGDGVAALEQRWEAAGGAAPFPALPPTGGRAAWGAFCAATLGFEPGDSGEDGRWRTFLARRYRDIAELDDAWGRLGEGRLRDFGEAALPGKLPAGGAELLDWYQFQALVLAAARAAHRFTVLLPVPVGSDEAEDVTARARRDLVTRVVNVQKPAHTVFDVRFYWSAFRLGEARLAEDTAIETASSQRLLRPAVLGAEHVGEAVLGGEPATVLRSIPRPGPGSEPAGLWRPRE